GEERERRGQDARHHLDGHQAEDERERSRQAPGVVRVDVRVPVVVHGQRALSIGARGARPGLRGRVRQRRRGSGLGGRRRRGGVGLGRRLLVGLCRGGRLVGGRRLLLRRALLLLLLLLVRCVLRRGL